MVEVTIADVLYLAPANSATVLLRETDGRRFLPLTVSADEAFALAFQLVSEEPPRPTTQRFIANLLAATGAKLEYVHLHSTELIEWPGHGAINAILAHAVLRCGETLREVDVRPSSALPLVALLKRPIYVAEALLDEAQLTLTDELNAKVGMGMRHLVRLSLTHSSPTVRAEVEEDDEESRLAHAEETAVHELLLYLHRDCPHCSGGRQERRSWWQRLRRDQSPAKSGFPIAHRGAATHPSPDRPQDHR